MRALRRPAPASSGFTLIELMIVVAIIGILMVSTMLFVRSSVRASLKGNAAVRVLERSRGISVELSRDLRAAKSVKTSPRKKAAREIDMVLMDGRTVRYGLEDGRLVRTARKGRKTVVRPVGDRVGTFRVAYRNKGGSVRAVRCSYTLADDPNRTFRVNVTIPR